MIGVLLYLITNKIYYKSIVIYCSVKYKDRGILQIVKVSSEIDLYIWILDMDI